MPARSIGTATISFGLVSIPTKLYTTNESANDISFNMLHDADGARLKQQYICTKCNEVVDRANTVKGYEYAKGQYVVLLRPFKQGLIMHQLRYSQEVKQWSEVPIPDLPEIKPAELGLAKQIIQQIAHETFSPDNYKDEVQARMMDLIQKKIEGQEITVVPEAPAGKVIDLMEALKASLGMAKGADADRKPAMAADAPAAEEPAKKKATTKKK